MCMQRSNIDIIPRIFHDGYRNTDCYLGHIGDCRERNILSRKFSSVGVSNVL